MDYSSGFLANLGDILLLLQFIHLLTININTK